MTTAIAALPPPLPGILASRFFGNPPTVTVQAAASRRPVSTSRFLRPRLTRFFNQAAKVRPKDSESVSGTAALPPPLSNIFSSRFYSKPLTAPAQTAVSPRPVSASRFLRPRLSRFFNQVAKVRPRVSR
ncbi:MAG: hypothetical protein ACRD16_01510, partial [Thermoanaerobaculia bacterium]